MLKILALISSLFISQISHAQQAAAKAYVSLNPAGDFVGQLKATGSATVTGSKVSAKNIVVDMKSLTTGLDLRDDHAKNKYLEVGKYPEAVLTEATGENGVGSGILKFHGQEKPVKGTYTISGKNLKADFDIKLSEFGIADINYKGIGVEDKVKIEVNVPIVAATSPPPAAAAGAPTGKPATVKPSQPLKK